MFFIYLFKDCNNIDMNNARRYSLIVYLQRMVEIVVKIDFFMFDIVGNI